MSLHTPNSEDLQKIHSEINQIVNQRLMLTTFAVTVFGAMMAWLIPKDSPRAGNEVGIFIYLASTLLVLFLFFIFLLTHYLTRILRIFTTYLDYTEVFRFRGIWTTCDIS